MNTQETGWCRPCPECGGDGTETYYPGGYGSYYCNGPAERTCSECDGDGVLACHVCGYDEPHDEYDCYGCEVGTIDQRVPMGGAA